MGKQILSSKTFSRSKLFLGTATKGQLYVGFYSCAPHSDLEGCIAASDFLSTSRLKGEPLIRLLYTIPLIWFLNRHTQSWLPFYFKRPPVSTGFTFTLTLKARDGMHTRPKWLTLRLSFGLGGHTFMWARTNLLVPSSVARRKRSNSLLLALFRIPISASRSSMFDITSPQLPITIGTTRVPLLNT